MKGEAEMSHRHREIDDACLVMAIKTTSCMEDCILYSEWTNRKEMLAYPRDEAGKQKAALQCSMVLRQGMRRQNACYCLLKRA